MKALPNRFAAKSIGDPGGVRGPLLFLKGGLKETRAVQDASAPAISSSPVAFRIKGIFRARSCLLCACWGKLVVDTKQL